MIKCGLPFEIDGIWKKEHLSEDLQIICNTYPENLNGTILVEHLG